MTARPSSGCCEITTSAARISSRGWIAVQSPATNALDHDQVAEQHADRGDGRSTERRDRVRDQPERRGHDRDPDDDLEQVPGHPGGVPAVVPAIAIAIRNTAISHTWARA